MFLPRFLLLLFTAVACGALWTLWLLHAVAQSGRPLTLLAALGATLLLPVLMVWQVRLYRQYSRRVLFLLEAVENNDFSLHFSPHPKAPHHEQLVNEALNRISQMLGRIKQDAVQQEKYYELILECAGSGILVLNDRGDVHQKNSEALRLLGLEVLTHIDQLNRIDPGLCNRLKECQAGDRLQVGFSNERGTVTLSVRVSRITVHHAQLRILSLTDINSELDEKEIEAWVRLTRVLTHEIMNSITPITSISDTLLQRMPTEWPEDVSEGLQTISRTGKELMHFVESYRRFTHIPTPVPHVFGVSEFAERMVRLARHQYAGLPLTITTHIQPDDLLLYADESLIAQVLVNLLKNAIQAIEAMPEEERRIELRAYTTPSEAVAIEVSNSGPAIPPEVAARIFIPFFSTKEGGSGIGLSVSRQIMRLSGGHLRLLPGLPVTFQLTFE